MDDPGNRTRPPVHAGGRDAPPKVDGRPPVPGGRARPADTPVPAEPQVAKAAVPAGVVAASTVVPAGPALEGTAPADPPPVRRSLFRKSDDTPPPGAAIWLTPADLAPAGIPDVVPPRSKPRGSVHRLPAAPEPPFAPCDGPYRWEARLPSAIGRTVTIRVGSTGMELGGTPVEFDDVSSVRFKLQVEAALFRRAASARMHVAVTRDDGTIVRIAARNALSTRRAEEIVSALCYLSAAFGAACSSRPRARMVERIGAGAEVVVGGIRMTRIGVAWKKRPIEPWSAIGDPVVVRDSVVIPTSGDPIEVAVVSDDAYVLPGLIPELRARFR